MSEGQRDEAGTAPAKTRAKADPAPIVFVGGTGRSGTHVAARLLARSEHFALIPVECRFHTDPDGFPGLLAGDVTLERFLKRMRGYWWRGFQTNRLRGLHRFVPRERFDRALAAFEAGFPSDRDAACRQLFLDLLAPVAEGWPERGIVEQSCDVVAQAPLLHRLFPEARFVHVVRDGRDASASRVSQTRGVIYPRNRRQGLEWWEKRIRAIEDGIRGVDDGLIHQVELGRFFGRWRTGALRKVSRHAGIPIERPMKRFMKTRMSPERANEERWRRDLSAAEQAEIETLYVAALERLERDGVSSVPLLRRAYERSGG